MFDGKHDKNGYNFKLMTFQYIYIERERELKFYHNHDKYVYNN